MVSPSAVADMEKLRMCAATERAFSQLASHVHTLWTERKCIVGQSMVLAYQDTHGYKLKVTHDQAEWIRVAPSWFGDDSVIVTSFQHDRDTFAKRGLATIVFSMPCPDPPGSSNYRSHLAAAGQRREFHSMAFSPRVIVVPTSSPAAHTTL